MKKATEKLDDLRYHDLGEAERETLAAIAKTPPNTPDLGAYLGVLASIRRQQGLLKHADSLLKQAFQAAGNNRAVHGQLYQRRSYVELDRGSIERALENTYRAASEWALAGDHDGIGRTLVDRGRLEYHAQQLEQSIATLESARLWLGKSSKRSHFSNEIGLALCLKRLRKLEAAEAACDRALVYDVGIGLRLHALVLRAELLEARERFAEAGGTFLEASEAAARFSPGNALLAGVRGIQDLARHDRSLAGSKALVLARFLGTFAQTRAVVEPLRDLLRDRQDLDPARLYKLENQLRVAIQRRRAARIKRAAHQAGPA